MSNTIVCLDRLLTMYLDIIFVSRFLIELSPVVTLAVIASSPQPSATLDYCYLFGGSGARICFSTLGVTSKIVTFASRFTSHTN